MAIWTQSGCANLHINICLQAGLSPGEGSFRAWEGDWEVRLQVGYNGKGLRASPDEGAGTQPVCGGGTRGTLLCRVSHVKTAIGHWPLGPMVTETRVYWCSVTSKEQGEIHG